jgi:hypothetical protein
MTRRAHLIGHTAAALEQPRAAGKPPDTTADHRQWPSRPKAPTFDSPPEPHISPGDASKEVTAQHVDVAQSRDFGLSSGRWVGGGKRGRSVTSKEEPGTRGRRQRRAGPASLGFPLTPNKPPAPPAPQAQSRRWRHQQPERAGERGRSTYHRS